MPKIRVDMHVDIPESVYNVEVQVPRGFEQMGYDDQHEIIEEILQEWRYVTLDWWDYSCE